MAGRAVSEVAHGQNGISGIAIDASRACWSTEGGTQMGIVCAALDGGAPALFEPQSSSAAALVEDTKDFFWLTTGPLPPYAVMKMAVEGGAPSQLALSPSDPSRMALDATNAYCTTGSDSGSVMAVTKADGSVSTLATGQGTPWGIEADMANVYWSNMTGNQIMKISLDGGGPVELATNQGAPGAVTVDDASVYWINSSTGTIMMTPIDGGPITQVASGVDGLSAMAVTPTTIFWGTNSRVMKLAKP